MKEKEDKKLNAFVDELMNSSNLETPSFNFTTNVMTQVNMVKQNATLTYQPLISKRNWALIFVVFIAFVSYIALVNKPEASGWFNGFDLTTLNSLGISRLFEGIHPSKVVTYGIGLFSLMLLIQIPFLKNYLDKRIEF